jgi:hypothetical protein
MSPHIAESPVIPLGIPAATVIPTLPASVYPQTVQYRYLFADLLTNQILAELPLTGVSFSQQLNTAGTFTAKLQLSGIGAADLNVANATIPARTAVYVDRGGVLVWGGVLWKREFTSKDQTLTLIAREFESYFERRRITADVVFTGDQLAAVQSIVNTAQAATNGNIGVMVGSETSGVTVNRTIYGYEYKTVFTAIQDLSRTSTGFDFNIFVYYDASNNPAKLLRLGYPRYGKTYSATSLSATVFELPGNIIEYAWPEDGSLAANYIFTLGAGPNPGRLTYTAFDGSKIAAGWPLLEEQANYSDVADSTLLAGLGNGQVAVVSYPPTTIKITIPASSDPILGSYEVGDDARVRILDDRFTSQLDAIYRIVAFAVQVGDSNNAETVTITLTSTSN